MSPYRRLAGLQALLFIPLCLIPMPVVPEDVWRFELGWDKVAHALFFWAFGLLLGAGWRRSQLRLRDSRTAAVVIGLSLALGLFGEIIQHFAPWRQGLDLDDLLADLAGGLLAWLSLPPLARFLPAVESRLSERLRPTDS